MKPAGDNSGLVHQSSLAVLTAETSGESRRNGRRSENFAYQYLKYLKGSLTRRKILRHGTSGFTSHPKECVLRIFIVLKNPSHRPGLNPRPLGSVASTLTATPPRRLTMLVHMTLGSSWNSPTVGLMNSEISRRRVRSHPSAISRRGVSQKLTDVSEVLDFSLKI
jgi:hypothetical protein